MYKKISAVFLIISFTIMLNGCAGDMQQAGLYSASKGMPVPSMAKKLTKNGIAFYEQGDYMAAFENLDPAYKMNPQDWDALYYRGLTHLKLKNYKEAVADFDRGRAWSPQMARFHVELANAYIEKGDFNRANVTFSWIFTSSLSYQPYTLKIHAYKAKLYLRMGKRKAALDQKNLAIQHSSRLIKVFEPDSALEDFINLEKRKSVEEQAMQAARKAENSGNIIEAFKQYEKAYFWSPESDVNTITERILSPLFQLYPNIFCSGKQFINPQMWCAAYGFKYILVFHDQFILLALRVLICSFHSAIYENYLGL